MSWFYRTFIRPTLFAQESEDIHNWTIAGLGYLSRRPLLTEAAASFLSAPDLPVELWNLQFPNPIGLAAGMDKEAEAVPAWQALGFGFSELGGVTWHAQPGNPRPRVFRAVRDEALVNRMGFNNPGAEAIARNLAFWREAGLWPKHPVGLNLGKSKITPLDKAPDEFAATLECLWPFADFFVINVSSPNTPNLRQLQDKAALDEILTAAQQVNRKLAAGGGFSGQSSSQLGAFQTQGHSLSDASTARPSSRPKPILVKVAPDLSFEALDDILTLVQPRSLAGIVATNTTVERPNSSEPRLSRIYAESGGLSGKPLRARSTEIIRHLFRQSKGSLPIIGVGGIFTADDAWEKITAGATLLQVYTGLVYEGPSLARQIVTGLIDKLEEASLATLSQAVGLEARD
jgi:dihydroorotate dehydrogenase